MSFEKIGIERRKYRVGQIVKDLLVPGESPEGRVARLEGGVVERVAVAPCVAHPHVEAGVGHHVGKALSRVVDDPRERAVDEAVEEKRNGLVGRRSLRGS